MLTQEQAVEIKVLARRGTAVREIARQTGLSRNTVRRYLRNEQANRYSPREPRATKLDPFKDYLLERVAAARPRWIPATVLLRELQDAGYEGGISQLKAFLVPHKRPEAEPVVRFETAPGKQMQADFTVIRRGREPLLALVATMGYSRASFVRFTAREDAATLCECLREALVYFGGTPEHVLFDNAKSVVIERDAFGEGEHRWNPQLLALAETYGFTSAYISGCVGKNRACRETLLSGPGQAGRPLRRPTPVAADGPGFPGQSASTASRVRDSRW
jgi:transposase